jgi:spermidine synthase
VRLAVVSGILFLSGASALLFETLWLRLSGLTFGNSVWSAALILSSFMAGLALGSALAASSTLPRLRPLQIYAGLEIIVAFSGCTLVFGLPLLGEWLRPIFQALWNFQQSLNPLRFSISFLILLIPTTAMGLTLPVLLEDPVLKAREFGRTIGVLYGFNTLGAVCGALVGELFLVRAFGLFGTGLTAAGLSCVAALIAASLSILESPAEKFGAPFKLRLSLGTRPPWRLLFLSMGTGAIFLSLEVIWFRFMRLYVASTSIAFCIMLAVVLAGIGLGGIASSVLQRRLASRNLIQILLPVAAIAVLLSYLFFPVPSPQKETGAFHIEWWQQIAELSAVLMFPVSFLSGILLPAILTCVQHQVSSRMNATGLTILWNTTGATVGPLLAAFVFLPSLGFQSSLILGAGGYAALTVLAIQRETWSQRRPLGIAVLMLVALFMLLVAVFPFSREETHFANARRPYEADGSHLTKRIEGTADTFQLLRRDLFGQPYYYRLVTNAYSMSGTLPRTQCYMRLFAYLPLALRPESEDALLICYGVGVTADALTRDAHLKHIDAVDISKEVFDLASSYPGPDYKNPLSDPRVTTFVQDGRFFLQACPRRYDIITGEPPPLKVAGTVNLYTEQFFSLMNGRLKDGGIATFWLPVYQLTTDETKAILHAFHNAFPQASVWAASDLEWIMMGIKPPLQKPNEQIVDAVWNGPNTRSDLVRIGIEVPEQISALFVMDGEEIERMTQGIEPLSDHYPKRLSDDRPSFDAAYQFGYTYLERRGASQRFHSSALIKEVWPNEWRESLENFFLVRQMRYVSQVTGSNWLEELNIYLRNTQLRTPVLAVEGSDEFRLALAEKTDSTAAPPNEVLHDLAAGALANRDFARAIQLLEIEKNRNVANANDLLLLIYLYCLNGAVEKAEALAVAQAGTIPKDAVTNWLWGELQAEFGFRPPR